MRGAAGIRAGILSLLALAGACAAALPDDAAVRALLAERIAQKRGVGFAVVLLDAKGTRIVTAGAARDGGPPVAADTEFEIGSITKTFTALLLADAIARGEAHADDPVARLLPAAASGLARDGKSVTLAQLASHTSGLPPLPTNWNPANRADPYADYDGAHLLAFLASPVLGRAPPAEYQYSNLGVGTLGYALTYQSGGYGSVLRERILAPLRMDDTTLDLSPTQEQRLAAGHDPDLKPAASWHLNALAGAGGLRSTALDMAKYLAAAADPATSPLAADFRLAQTPIAEGPTPALRIGLAWHLTQRGATTHIWHNGRTGGYASMIALDPATHEGVVVLSNASISVDDLALHLLDATNPLAPPPKQHTVARVDPAVFDRIAGRYELAPNFVLAVRREGDRLFAQATGQGIAEVFPEGEYEYFYTIVDAQLSFRHDGAGNVTGVVLHQGGRDVDGRKLGQ